MSLSCASIEIAEEVTAEIIIDDTANVVEVETYDSVIISEVMLKNDTLLQADDGSFPGWIEITNNGDTAVSLDGWKINFYFQDDIQKTLPPFPNLIVQPGIYKLFVFTSSASTISYPSIRITTDLDFSLQAVELENAAGESENYFTIPQKKVKTNAEPPERNISYIRDPSFLPAIRWTDKPSPGMSNDTEIPVPQFSLESGFYDSPVLDFSNVKSIEEGWEIRYTINDGMEFDDKDHIVRERKWIYPTNVSGTLFTEPVILDKTSVIKARYYSPTGASSNEVVRTYFVGEDTELPVFSIIVDPADLWDDDVGIYTVGNDSDNPNFFEKWFRLASVDFFEDKTKKNPDFSDRYLIRTYGSSSKLFPQKSLAIYAKSPGSTDRIPNMFFHDGSARNILDFYSIVLRNSGGDISRTFFRDGLMTGIATDNNIEKQDFQPSVVFLNGQYWGLMNIREKVNEYFLEDHSEVSSNEIDLVEGTYMNTVQVNEGSPNSFLEMSNFVNKNDPVYNNIYQRYKDYFDIDNLINYSIFQIFYNNTDWPWSNAKFWRSPTYGVKWRWVMYDTDAGFDTVGYWTEYLDYLDGAAKFNFIEYLLGDDVHSDILSITLKTLLRNKDFYEIFFSRFDELLDTVFLTEDMVKSIDKHAFEIEDEMQRHMNRWKGIYPFEENVWNIENAIINWNDEVQILRDFAEARPRYIKQYIEEYKQQYSYFEPIRILGGDFESNQQEWDLGWSVNRTVQEINNNETGNFGYLRILEEKQNYWDSVAFVHDDIFLAQGESLIFSFDAKVLKPFNKEENLLVILFDPDTDEVVFSYILQPGTEWETQTFQLEYSGQTSSNNRLQFRTGKLSLGQELFIDNIFLEVME